ncbi:hypothetical protein SDC9_96610 [bioreactor metagenome]|uniref:Uncharacterized protein n=1 Tax=bioreactor metagenome TaxID=1076179 RepID=A0A645AAD7_9ZZZZ
MKYIRKNSAGITEERPSSPYMGTAWYEERGWLPYAGTLPLDRLNVEGCTVVELPAPETVQEPRIFSKLKIFENLDTLGFWKELGPKIEAAGGEYWQLANDVREDHPKFQAVLADLSAFAASRGLDINEFLDKCVMEV